MYQYSTRKKRKLTEQVRVIILSDLWQQIDEPQLPSIALIIQIVLIPHRS